MSYQTSKPAPRDGSVWAIFDFSFEKFAAPKLIKILYVFSVIALFVGYLLSVAWTWILTHPVSVTTMQYPNRVTGLAQQPQLAPAILVAVLGLIPLLGGIFMARVGLELVMSIVRSSIDLRALRDRYAGGN